MGVWVYVRVCVCVQVSCVRSWSRRPAGGARPEPRTDLWLAGLDVLVLVVGERRIVAEDKVPPLPVPLDGAPLRRWRGKGRAGAAAAERERERERRRRHRPFPHGQERKAERSGMCAYVYVCVRACVCVYVCVCVWTCVCVCT